MSKDARISRPQSYYRCIEVGRKNAVMHIGDEWRTKRKLHWKEVRNSIDIISIISSIPVLGLELDEKRGIWELILFPRSDIVGPQCAFVFFSDSEGSFLCHSI